MVWRAAAKKDTVSCAILFTYLATFNMLGRACIWGTCRKGTLSLMLSLVLLKKGQTHGYLGKRDTDTSRCFPLI